MYVSGYASSSEFGQAADDGDAPELHYVASSDRREWEELRAEWDGVELSSLGIRRVTWAVRALKKESLIQCVNSDTLPLAAARLNSISLMQQLVRASVKNIRRSIVPLVKLCAEHHHLRLLDELMTFVIAPEECCLVDAATKNKDVYVVHQLKYRYHYGCAQAQSLRRAYKKAADWWCEMRRTIDPE
ncbi:hypothetical protein CYMTET_40332 [Cymbomonas tetramitiformis]|uniref:Uncharacterized protein n=1 Tax=Cymbomonas tetramitiformis TaxID=36881 RepID=A0AAE0F3R2_9CHLO|nr:hypothetical protein CYMTET_40332 [Cymbomonas tetramitiformis]|eukprot:gene4881-5961_t